jgi:hypothetical protein
VRLQKYILNELWIKPFSKKIEVLEIPPDSMSDIKELNASSIRFTAIKKTKKLYVWNAYEVNHQKVWNGIFKTGYSSIPNTQVLQGAAVKIGNKWEMSVWDDYEWMDYEVRENLDVKVADIIKGFKWVNPYIKINKLLNNYMKEYD